VPILGDLLSRAMFLAAMPAGVGALVTAVLLVVSQDWRLNVLALAAQYFFMTLLMTQVVRVELAAVKGLIGWVICVVFYLTEQQAQSMASTTGSGEPMTVREWFTARVEAWRQTGISAQAAFSLMAAVVVGVTVYVALPSVPLPEVSTSVALVCYFLVGMGILLLGLSRDPLRAGIGMLMILSGFDLFYVALEPSLVVTGLLGSINFVIALGAAFLKAGEAVTADQEVVE